MKVEAEMKVEKRPKWDSEQRLSVAVGKQVELTSLGLYSPSAYFGEKELSIVQMRSTL